MRNCPVAWNLPQNTLRKCLFSENGPFCLKAKTCPRRRALFNKSLQFQAKQQLRRLFWGQFQSIGQSLTVFLTSFSFLTKVGNFEGNVNCAEFFDANFQQHDSCAGCFAQGLGFQQKSPTSSKTTVAQTLLTKIPSNTTVAHGVLDKF